MVLSNHQLDGPEVLIQDNGEYKILFIKNDYNPSTSCPVMRDWIGIGQIKLKNSKR